MEEFKKAGKEYQRLGKQGFDAAIRTYAEVNKGVQTVVAKFVDYSNRAFEDGVRAIEQLAGATSVEQVVEIQSQYAKKAFETYLTEVSTLSELYLGAARTVSKPIESTSTKKVA